MNKVIAFEDKKGLGVWGKTSRALKVALPYVNGRFLLDSWRILWLMNIIIDSSAPPRQFYLDRYYRKLIGYLGQPELEGSALRALVRYPIENQRISKWVRSEILSWLSHKCIDDPNGAFSGICHLVNSGYFDPKEGDALRNILGFNVNEIEADDITENVAKITGDILWRYLHHRFSKLMNPFFPPDSGKQVGPLLPLIARIGGKLELSEIISVIEKQNAQIGFYLANQPVEQGIQNLMDLTTIGYFSQKGGEIMRKIRVYNTDFNLAEIQNDQEREKVAEIALHFLMGRLIALSPEAVERKLITAMFKKFGNHSCSHDKLPHILKEAMNIFPHKLDCVRTIVESLGSPSARHIPGLLELAEEVACDRKCPKEAKTYPLTLLLNESMKPTIDQLDSLIEALHSDVEGIRNTALELIGRMDSGTARKAIPELIGLANDETMDRLKALLQKIGAPLEQHREQIRNSVNSWETDKLKAELAVTSLNQMSFAMEDVNAIINLREGPPELRVACAQAILIRCVPKYLLDYNINVFETLKQFAVDREEPVREPALKALFALKYFNQNTWDVAKKLLIGGSITSPCDKACVEGSLLKLLLIRYAGDAFIHAQNGGEIKDAYPSISRVLIDSGLLTNEEEKQWFCLANDLINLKKESEGEQGKLSALVRDLLGKEYIRAVSMLNPQLSEKRLTNRLSNLSSFGRDGLMSAVELLCKMYEKDPKMITRERLDIFAGMGIYLEENDFEDFYKLFRNNHWLAEIDPKKVTFNTIPLLWSDDPGKFIDAELKKLEAGLNIFTGPLAKTLMNKMLIMPETAIDKDGFIPALIKEIFYTEREIRKLVTRSSNKNEADHSLMKSLSKTLRDAGLKDFTLLPR